MLIYYIYNITTKISELHENENETYFHKSGDCHIRRTNYFLR